MQRPDGNLDQQFQQAVSHLSVLALSQPRAAKLRVQAWLTKLREPTSNPVWKRNRNTYCTLLLAQLQQGYLDAPFTNMPPDGSLPNLPNHLVYRSLSPLRGQFRSRSTSPTGAPAASPAHQHQHGAASHHPNLDPGQVQGLVHTFHSNMRARGFDLTQPLPWSAGHSGDQAAGARPAAGTDPQRKAQSIQPGHGGSSGARGSRVSCGASGTSAGHYVSMSRDGASGAEDAVKLAAPGSSISSRAHSQQSQRDQERVPRSQSWGALGGAVEHDAYTDQDAAAAMLLAAKEAEIAARVAAKRHQHQQLQQQRQYEQERQQREYQQQQQERLYQQEQEHYRQQQLQQLHYQQAQQQLQERQYQLAQQQQLDAQRLAQDLAAAQRHKQRVVTAKAHLDSVLQRYSGAAQQWASPSSAGGARSAGGGALLMPGAAGGGPAGPAAGDELKSGSAYSGVLKLLRCPSLDSSSGGSALSSTCATHRPRSTPPGASCLTSALAGEAGTDPPQPGEAAPSLCLWPLHEDAAPLDDPTSRKSNNQAALSPPSHRVHVPEHPSPAPAPYDEAAAAAQRGTGRSAADVGMGRCPVQVSSAAAPFSSTASPPRRSVLPRSVFTSPQHLAVKRLRPTQSDSPASGTSSSPGGRQHNRSRSPSPSGSPNWSRNRPSPDPALTYRVVRKLRSSPRALKVLVSDVAPQPAFTGPDGFASPSSSCVSGARIVAVGVDGCRPGEAPQAGSAPIATLAARRAAHGSKFEFSSLLAPLVPEQGVPGPSDQGIPEMPHKSTGGSSNPGHVSWTASQEATLANGGGYVGVGSGEFESPGSSRQSASLRAVTLYNPAPAPNVSMLASQPVNPQQIASPPSQHDGSSLGGGLKKQRSMGPLALRLVSPPDSPRLLAAKAAAAATARAAVAARVTAALRRLSPVRDSVPSASRPPPQRSVSGRASPAVRSAERLPHRILQASGRPRPSSVPTASRFRSESQDRRPPEPPPRLRPRRVVATRHARASSQPSEMGAPSSTALAAPNYNQLTEMARRSLPASLPPVTVSARTETADPTKQFSRFLTQHNQAPRNDTGGGSSTRRFDDSTEKRETAAAGDAGATVAPCGTMSRPESGRLESSSSLGTVDLMPPGGGQQPRPSIMETPKLLRRLDMPPPPPADASRRSSSSTVHLQSRAYGSNSSVPAQPASPSGMPRQGFTPRNSASVVEALEPPSQRSSDGGGSAISAVVAAVPLGDGRFMERPATEATVELAALDVETVIRDFEQSIEDRFELTLRPTPSGPTEHLPAVATGRCRVPGPTDRPSHSPEPPSSFAPASRLADRFALQSALEDFRIAFERLKRRLSLHATDPAVAATLYGRRSSSGGGGVVGGGGSLHGASDSGFASSVYPHMGSACAATGSVTADAGTAAQPHAPGRHAGAPRAASAETSFGAGGGWPPPPISISGLAARAEAQAEAAERFCHVASEALAHYRQDVNLLLARVRAVLQLVDAGGREAGQQHSQASTTAAALLGGSAGLRRELEAMAAAEAVADHGVRAGLVLQVLHTLEDSAHQLGLQLLTLAAAPMDLPAPALEWLGAELRVSSEGGASGGFQDRRRSVNGATLSAFNYPRGTGGEVHPAQQQHIDRGPVQAMGRGVGNTRASQGIQSNMSEVVRTSGDGRVELKAMGSGLFSSTGATAGSGTDELERRISGTSSAGGWTREGLGDMPTPFNRSEAGHEAGVGLQRNLSAGFSRGDSGMLPPYLDSYPDGVEGATPLDYIRAGWRHHSRDDSSNHTMGQATDSPGEGSGQVNDSGTDGNMGQTRFLPGGLLASLFASPPPTHQPNSAATDRSQSSTEYTAYVRPLASSFPSPPPPYRAQPLTEPAAPPPSASGISLPNMSLSSSPPLVSEPDLLPGGSSQEALHPGSLREPRSLYGDVGLGPVEMGSMRLAASDPPGITDRQNGGHRPLGRAGAQADGQFREWGANVATLRLTREAQAARAAAMAARDAAQAAAQDAAAAAERQAAQAHSIREAVLALREAAQITALEAAAAAADRQAAQAAAREAAEVSSRGMMTAAECSAAAEAAALAAASERQAAEELVQEAAQEAAQVAARQAAEAAREAARMAAREAAQAAARETAQTAAREVALAAARESVQASGREAAALAAAREAVQATAREATAAAAARDAAQEAAREAAAAAERHSEQAAEREAVHVAALEAAVAAAREAAAVALQAAQAATREVAEVNNRDLTLLAEREAAQKAIIEEAVSAARQAAQAIAREVATAAEREVAAAAERQAAVAAAREAAAAAERQAALAAEREVAAAAALEAAVEAAREAVMVVAHETVFATASQAAQAAAREAAAVAERDAAVAHARDAAMVAVAREVAEITAREAATAAAAREAAQAAAREVTTATARHAAQVAEREAAQASALKAAVDAAREAALTSARETALSVAREAAAASSREAALAAAERQVLDMEREAAQASALQAAVDAAREAALTSARETALSVAREAAAASSREAALAAAERQVLDMEREAAQASALEAVIASAREVVVASAREAAAVAERQKAAVESAREETLATARELALATAQEAATTTARQVALATAQEAAAVSSREAALASAIDAASASARAAALTAAQEAAAAAAKEATLATAAAAHDAAAATAEREAAQAAALAAGVASSIAMRQSSRLDQPSPFRASRSNQDISDGRRAGPPDRLHPILSPQPSGGVGTAESGASSVCASIGSSATPQSRRAHGTSQSLAYRALVWELDPAAAAASVSALGARDVSPLRQPLPAGAVQPLTPVSAQRAAPAAAAAAVAVATAAATTHEVPGAPSPTVRISQPATGAGHRRHEELSRPASYHDASQDASMPRRYDTSTQNAHSSAAAKRPEPTPCASPHPFRGGLPRQHSGIASYGHSTNLPSRPDPPRHHASAEPLRRSGEGYQHAAAAGPRPNHRRCVTGDGTVAAAEVQQAYSYGPSATAGGLSAISSSLAGSEICSSSSDPALEDFRYRRQQLASSPPPVRPQYASVTATPSLHERRPHSAVAASAGRSTELLSAIHAAAAAAAAAAAVLDPIARREYQEFQHIKRRLGLMDASPPGGVVGRRSEASVAAPGSSCLPPRTAPVSPQQSYVPQQWSRSSRSGSGAGGLWVGHTTESYEPLSGAGSRIMDGSSGSGAGVWVPEVGTDQSEMALRLQRLAERTSALQQRVQLMVRPSMGCELP